MSSLIAIMPSGRDSPASSLGPSDSTSQQLRTDSQLQVDPCLKALGEELMLLVEAPDIRPDLIPRAVLWEFRDCLNDPLGEIIVTEANRSRPRMSLALRHYTGQIICSKKAGFIRSSAAIIMRKLVASVDLDPRILPYGSKPRTKKLIKDLFPAEYYQAILDLEAEHPVLRLCASHWKADAMIGQAFLRRSEQGGNDEDQEEMGRGSERTTSSNAKPFKHTKFFQPPKPSQTAPTIPVQDVPPTNAGKRAYEMSPGPKSPSASQVQKRSKDTMRPFAPKASNPSVPCKCHICPISNQSDLDSFAHSASTPCGTQDNPIIPQPH